MVQWCDGATVRRYNGATVQWYDGATVRRCGGAGILIKLKYLKYEE